MSTTEQIKATITLASGRYYRRWMEVADGRNGDRYRIACACGEHTRWVSNGVLLRRLADIAHRPH